MSSTLGNLPSTVHKQLTDFRWQISSLNFTQGFSVLADGIPPHEDCLDLFLLKEQMVVNGEEKPTQHPSLYTWDSQMLQGALTQCMAESIRSPLPLTPSFPQDYAEIWLMKQRLLVKSYCI